MAVPSALKAHAWESLEPAIFRCKSSLWKAVYHGLPGGACEHFASITSLGATGTGVTGIFGIPAVPE